MNPTRLLRLLLVTILAGLVAAALLTGCSSGPDEPTFDNPFDPDNPSSTNPFELGAYESEGQVYLSWQQLDGYGFVVYYPQHQADGSIWTTLDTLEASTGELQYICETPAPTAVNYFRIVAADDYGVKTSSGPLVPVSVDVPPVIDTADGETALHSRLQDLVIGVTAGDLVQVSLDSEFGSYEEAAREDTVAIVEDFDLGTAVRDSSLVVFARTVTDLGGGLPPIYSGLGIRTFTIAATSAITQQGGGATVPGPAADILVADQAAGIDSMRFAASEDALWDEPWQPGAETALAVPLQDTVEEQTLWAQFKRDFGFLETTILTLQADDLDAADFAADLPSNRISETPAITLLHDAVAQEMRTSQFSDFHDTDWVAYSDTSEIVLVPQDDQYLYPLFVQYRNHWFESATRTDFALLGGGEVRVDFTHPLQGTVIEGGSTIDMSGTAETFDASLPITLVQVHVGDGWVDAAGTDNWEYVWDVPLMGGDTVWSLGVLATAQDDDRHETGRAWITVTISQLTVAITAPADAAEVTRGLPVQVTGTATPFLAGAPLDSVVVTVLDERITAGEPLDSWMVDWLVPVEAPDLIDITAWGYAGDDSVSHRIQVSAVDDQ